MNIRSSITKEAVREAQKKYFLLIEKLFGSYYQDIDFSKSTFEEIINKISFNPQKLNKYLESAEEIEKKLIDFWSGENGVCIYRYLMNSTFFKSVIDKPEMYSQIILPKSSIYIHTTILPDPLSKYAGLYRSMDKIMAYIILMSNVISILFLKAVVFAKIDPPILIIAPDVYQFLPEIREYISSRANKEIYTHFGKMFGKSFTNEHELKNYLKEIKTIDDIKKTVIDSDKLLIGDKDKSIEQSINNLIEVAQWSTQADFNESIGIYIWRHFHGVFNSLNDIKMKSEDFGAVPVLNSETSYQYIIWEHLYDYELSINQPVNLNDILLPTALENKEFTWLEDIPITDLIKLRQEGILEEVRVAVSRGINNITTSNESNYKETVKAVSENISRCFVEYQDKLKKQKTEDIRYLVDVSQFVVQGSLSIAAFLLPDKYYLQGMGLISSIFGAQSVHGLFTKAQDLNKNLKSIKRSPAAFLFKTYKKRNIS